VLIPAINDVYRASEPAVVLPLAGQARLAAEVRARIARVAKVLAETMRQAAHSGGGIEHFLQQYRISSAEGIVLLCLAEAFLRIPDDETADRLIRDKVGAAAWEAHLGKSPSSLVNAATAALNLTGRLLAEDETAGVFKRLLARLGEPVVRQAVATAMRFMGEQFVMGRTIVEALERSERPDARPFRHSFDMLGEGAKTAADAARYGRAYQHAIAAIGATVGQRSVFEAPGISVKLSALHPRYEPAQRDRVLRELVPLLLGLAEEARGYGMGFTVDAEESERLELSLELFARVAAAPSLAGWDGLGLAVQAYQKRALPVILWLDALGRQTERRIFVRLVKGAYWDSEVKRTQERGLPDYAVFTRKSATDVSYLACARAMLDAKHVFPAFATHNALTVATILDWAGANRDFEFQRLHGMGGGLYETLLARAPAPACRTYAPVGSHDDLLAYLVRRLLENGANSSFVHQIQDPGTPLESLLEDPVEAVIAAGGEPHPRIVLPRDLYGEARRNSDGLDLSDSQITGQLTAALAQAWARPWIAHSLAAGAKAGSERIALFDPACTGRPIGEAWTVNAGDIARMVETGAVAQRRWSATDVAQRAACLRRAADLLEGRRTEFMAVAVREAGKTIPDAVAEVREAVDFLRYYAGCAETDFRPVLLPGPTGEENRLTLAGRGVFACISPWNFPLAIFVGQVAAALAAGNAVVAKPAPQTPVMAHRAVALLHEAGIPADVLQLALGRAEAGQALIAHPLVRGVAFTGSIAAAKAIARSLVAGDGPLVPLIAETGGQNAMIADSSALPEQVVSDLVVSAFLSAGQRCSAARVLFVQDVVADKLLEMLVGATQELTIGDPGSLATDIGPVIDEAALRRLESHVAAMGSRVVHRSPAPGGGWFFGPAVIELEDLASLKGEVFGPVLHVVRWHAGHLDAVVDAINATGYGLTLGVHSRIGATVKHVRQRARVGNLYVNRSMVGAVVGVQPFGGEGLSGTGPKAGGPNYLKRFATERVVSVDTTSAGGNATLMTLPADGGMR
jgi:RHH-type proline utilization regulon transcriptional repressor/proline dehydrogenase/delta 1-pyrroline-5-carboxylate dehydrogenase